VERDFALPKIVFQCRDKAKEKKTKPTERVKYRQTWPCGNGLNLWWKAGKTAQHPRNTHTQKKTRQVNTTHTWRFLTF